MATELVVSGNMARQAEKALEEDWAVTGLLKFETIIGQFPEHKRLPFATATSNNTSLFPPHTHT